MPPWDTRKQSNLSDEAPFQHSQQEEEERKKDLISCLAPLLFRGKLWHVAVEEKSKEKGGGVTNFHFSLLCQNGNTTHCHSAPLIRRKRFFQKRKCGRKRKKAMPPRFFFFPLSVISVPRTRYLPQISLTHIF